MTEQHVDLVQNDLDDEVQRVAARVFMNGQVTVKPEEKGEWERMVYAALGEHASAPDALDRLAGLFHGSYIWATKPHVQAECPFANGPIRMTRQKVTRHQRQSA